MKRPSPPQAFRGRNGFTVLEAVVYAGLALAVLVLAAAGLGRMQKGAYRGQEMTRMQSDADEALRLLAQDSRNLGLKRVLYSDAGTLVDTQLARVDFRPADSSSFQHRDGDPYDTLTFIRPELDAAGRPVAIDTIRYAVDPATGILSRRVNAQPPMEVCRQVDAIQFEYGVSAVKSDLADENPPDAAHWTRNPAAAVSQSGAELKAAAPGPGRISFWLSSRPLNLSGRRTYQVEFTSMADAKFLANVDSACIAIYNGGGTPIAMQSFLPEAASSTLYLDWSGVSCANCYAGFRLEMKGPGEFNLGRFRFTEVAQGDGAWTAHPTVAQKNAVRSYRVHLLTRSSRGIAGARGRTFRLADLDLAFNDDLGRNLLEEIVAVPNNGD